MQEIFKEFGPAIITFFVIVALIGLVATLIGSDQTSVVGKAFSDLINSFFSKASGAIN